MVIGPAAAHLQVGYKRGWYGLILGLVPICYSLRAPGSWNPENQLKTVTVTIRPRF